MTLLSALFQSNTTEPNVQVCVNLACNWATHHFSVICKKKNNNNK